jgi:hypothetical protein
MKLLSVLGIGFGQAMYALDAADGETESGFAVGHVTSSRFIFDFSCLGSDRQPSPSRSSCVAIIP